MKNNTNKYNIEKIAELISTDLKKRAMYYDENPQFQTKNFDLIKEKNFLKIAIPKNMGGLGINLSSIIKSQIKIAQGDASTALGIGMHTIVCGFESENHLWPKQKRESIFKDIISNATLINNIASEAELGSPKSGGKPQTKIFRDKNNLLRLKGKKNWATISTGLDHLIVYAYNNESHRLCRVLVNKHNEKIQINKQWNGLGMRSTESHEIIFNNVIINKSDILYEHGQSKKHTKLPFNAWFPLIIGATSLGIAIEARSQLINYLNSRQPTGYKKPVSTIPFIKHELGRIDSKIMTSINFLISVSEAWESNNNKDKLIPYVMVAKRESTEAAVYITDSVMRLVGGIGLEKENQFERFFRDARSGLINPPIEARALETIAEHALQHPDNKFLI